jgi:hypothetical protein
MLAETGKSSGHHVDRHRERARAPFASSFRAELRVFLATSRTVAVHDFPALLHDDERRLAPQVPIVLALTPAFLLPERLTLNVADRLARP